MVFVGYLNGVIFCELVACLVAVLYPFCVYPVSICGPSSIHLVSLMFNVLATSLISHPLLPAQLVIESYHCIMNNHTLGKCPPKQT